MAERRGRRKKSVNTKKGEGVRAGRPRDQLADEAILRAASDLFGEYGIEGATVEQIATRAGVARTTVYRRWSSREDIIVQAIESARNFPEQIMDGFEELQPDELVHLVLKISLDALTRLQFRKLTMRLIGSS